MSTIYVLCWNSKILIAHFDCCLFWFVYGLWRRKNEKKKHSIPVIALTQLCKFFCVFSCCWCSSYPNYWLYLWRYECIEILFGIKRIKKRKKRKKVGKIQNINQLCWVVMGRQTLITTFFLIKSAEQQIANCHVARRLIRLNGFYSLNCDSLIFHQTQCKFIWKNATFKI